MRVEVIRSKIEEILESLRLIEENVIKNFWRVKDEGSRFGTC